MAWKGSLGAMLSNTCSSRATQSRVPRDRSRWLLNTSKEETPPSLWAACATAPAPTQHRSVQGEPPVFHFLPTASCPGTSTWHQSQHILLSSFKLDNKKIYLSKWALLQTVHQLAGCLSASQPEFICSEACRVLRAIFQLHPAPCWR